MDKKFTKKEARLLFDVPNDAQLAKKLGITRQALFRFSDDDPLPDGRQWQIRALIAEGKIAA